MRNSSRFRTIRSLAALAPLAVVAGLLVGAAPSGAAQLTLEGSTLVYRADAGETNDTLVGSDVGNPTAIRIADPAAPTIGPGLDCEVSEVFGRFEASCAPDGIAAIRLELGDGDDQLSVADDLPFSGPFSADGGPGNDNLRGLLRDFPVVYTGGDGNDKLDGSGGGDQLHGGPGNDEIGGGGGNDELRGDDGDDRLNGGQALSSDILDGGAGHDTIDADWYDNNAPTNSVNVTLDGVADDGRPGEGDNVINVETIKTRQAARLVAAGDPVVFDVTGTGAGTTTLIGSPGADRLRSYDYDDTIQAGAGNDSVEAGNGNDTIDLGPGQDSLVADAGAGSCNFLECRGLFGNDTIQARDGERDTIDCGVGTDRVVADAIDVLSNCENVELGPVAGPPTPPAGGGTKPPAKACKVPKVKRGSTLKATRSRLKKARCKVGKVRKVRSTTRRGRVVKLTVKAGRKTAKPVGIRVSRGRR